MEALGYFYSCWNVTSTDHFVTLGYQEALDRVVQS